MPDVVNVVSAEPSPPRSTPTTKPQGGRQRIIASCLTCRRRKVKCDHGHPICGACIRGNHVCTYATDQGSLHQPSLSTANKVTKSPIPGASRSPRSVDVQSRLDRLELLLEKAVAGQGLPHPPGTTEDHATRDYDHTSALTPSTNSNSSHGAAGLSSDGQDGILLLEDGQSQFVSSLHWALLADEIQDIKALLGDRSEEETAEKARHSNPKVSLLSLGTAPSGISLASLLPQSQEQCDQLLNIFFSHVDPMTRIIHKPTLIRKFDVHIREANPIAFAVFFAATNAISPSTVESKFREKKDVLLERYQQGVEISLARENYLTTSSLEVLQGFLLWLTCITKEDDMGKAWALLGLTIRIGLNQGLHRDPSLFPAGSLDVITIELRRRLWHQICHLEYRAAECKGQEPTVADDDFTTLMPRNVNDDDLLEGASPGAAPYDEEKYTDMSFQLVRFNGMRCLRRIIQSTYRLERRILDSGLQGTSAPDPVFELQQIYQQIKVMLDDLHEENRRKYLRFCNPEIPVQRLCLGLASLLEWRAWVLFWLRMPRAYRDIVFSTDIRNMIFEKSINLIETINGATVDVDAARFQWHIGGHASFQAIMHVLSELRNPDFEIPDRLRALRALQMSRTLKENNTSRAWLVVKSMIDKVIADHLAGRVNMPQDSYVSLKAETSSNNLRQSTQSPQLPQADYNGALYVNQIPSYAIEQPIPYSDPSTLLNCGDMNLGNLAGVDTNNDVSMDFDWGFWGDPVSLGPVEYPLTF